MEFFSVHFEPDPADQEASKLVSELKNMRATRVAEWLWVLRSDLESSELHYHLRKFRKAEDFVVEKITRTRYRSLLHMAEQALKNPTKPSMLNVLTSLAYRGRPK